MLERVDGKDRMKIDVVPKRVADYSVRFATN